MALPASLSTWEWACWVSAVRWGLERWGIDLAEEAIQQLWTSEKAESTPRKALIFCPHKAARAVPPTHSRKILSLVSFLTMSVSSSLLLGFCLPWWQAGKIHWEWYDIKFTWASRLNSLLVKTWEIPCEKLTLVSHKNDLNSHYMSLSFTFLPLHLEIPQTSSILRKLKTHKKCLKHELSWATWAVGRY